ncbi:MAG TPA: non-canonical purine NTP pyrophosphatase [Candidatus Saccharimonadales bacterium]|nr:non-canonical purine NTP pyrophosphatase [Candidatus Saccharimonadales bacterium]
MQRLPVESSDIVSVGYDPKTRVLEIEFKENRVYQYRDVEPDVYERFLRADSYGQYFYAFISGHYRYDRLEQKSDGAPPTPLAFVTSNLRKFQSLQQACEPLGIELERLELPVDETQSYDAQEIALKKAKSAYKLARRPVVVNDAFWNIIALKGFPGAFMGYMAGWLQPEDFLRLMEGKQDRTVVCSDTLVYYDGKRSKLFAHDSQGAIVDAPRGQGLSIEQLVVIAGQNETIAERYAKEPLSPRPPAVDGIWHAFAKWYNLQRRLGKV